MRVEMYFDFSCPYAYLASTCIERVALAGGATLHWRPILLGGVFRGLAMPETPMGSMPPAKARHNLRDMQRWAERRGVPLRTPSGHPLRTTRALRALLSLDEVTWPSAIHALYRAYWVDGVDISTEAGLRAALEAVISDPAKRRRIAERGFESVFERGLLWRANAERALALVFGRPGNGHGVGQTASVNATA